MYFMLPKWSSNSSTTLLASPVPPQSSVSTSQSFGTATTLLSTLVNVTLWVALAVHMLTSRL